MTADQLFLFTFYAQFYELWLTRVFCIIPGLTIVSVLSQVKLGLS